MMGKRNILITGGAGFIGNHVVRLFVNKYPEYRIVNLDKLTYAGNLENLKDVEDAPNYDFVRADIVDLDDMRRIFRVYDIDGVIHLAAESHVDRSIADPFVFARTNCCRLPRSTGSHVQRATAVSCFIIFPRMRSMAPCRLLPAAPSHLMVTSCLWKRQNMIRTAHIPHRKRPAIILLGRIMTHTGCRL